MAGVLVAFVAADALGITVGALGILNLVMMAPTAATRDRQPLEGFGTWQLADSNQHRASMQLLVPSIAFQQELLLWLAVTAWSAAFLLLLRRLLRTRHLI